QRARAIGPSASRAIPTKPCRTHPPDGEDAIVTGIVQFVRQDRRVLWNAAGRRNPATNTRRALTVAMLEKSQRSPPRSAPLVEDRTPGRRGASSRCELF